jgi:multiple sugar transport system permease protein
MSPKLSRLLFFILVLAIALTSLFPPYVILVSSLQIEEQVFSSPARFFPNPINIANYLTVWKVMPLLRYIMNGLYVSVGTICTVLVIASLAAFPLARLKIPGKKAIMLGLLFTQMFAPAVVLLPLFRIFRSIGMLNSLTGLVVVNSAFTLAFTTLLIAGFFETVPHEVLESAIIDGCSKLELLTRMLMPITKSGYLVVSVYVFTVVWNEFLYSLTFISSSIKYVPIVGLFNFIQVPGDMLPPWHLIMTVSSIISVPALILFFIQRGSLAKGLTAGSIK